LNNSTDYNDTLKLTNLKHEFDRLQTLQTDRKNKIKKLTKENENLEREFKTLNAELDSSNTEIDDADYDLSELESAPQQIIYDLSLNSIYGSSYEDTIKILSTVDNPSYLFENGIPGIVKTTKLLKWGNIKKTIDVQTKIIEVNKIKGDFPYLTGWVFNYTYGPNKYEQKINFQNFMKNEFKPNVEQRLKLMEDGDKKYGVTGLDGKPCPKYFKTWESQSKLDERVEAILNVQRNNKKQYEQILAEIKRLYLAKKGIWIKDEKDPNKAIPTDVRWCSN
jgi:hypothetical protein